LTQELSDFVRDQPVTKVDAFPVPTFQKLMDHVSRLAYLNKDYLLFFRGQGNDFKNKAGASTFYPSIYRGDRLSRGELDLRFDILSSAARRLFTALEEAQIEGYQDVKRRKYVQWSVLQHYEVCPTPLLDLTHSVRVACSFAFLSTQNKDAYVLVFGLPYITNRISINSEHDIVNIRLLSICPPDALRPYYQEGYLAGTDEVTTEYDSKDELDFNNRLIAKFRLINDRIFWGKGFDAIPKSALYPSGDRVKEICDRIKGELGTEVEPGRLGRFLQEWTDLENLILNLARRRKERVFSLREAISLLSSSKVLTVGMQERLDRLRRLRNIAVHDPKRLEPEDLANGINEISVLRSETRKLKY
jgi:uncharacterized protein YutE (UPF0331/DUF86 family)